jgi:hypothetical protein
VTKEQRRGYMARWRAENPERTREIRRESARRCREAPRRKWADIAAEAAKDAGQPGDAA